MLAHAQNPTGKSANIASTHMSRRISPVYVCPHVRTCCNAVGVKMGNVLFDLCGYVRRSSVLPYRHAKVPESTSLHVLEHEVFVHGKLVNDRTRVLDSTTDVCNCTPIYERIVVMAHQLRLFRMAAVAVCYVFILCSLLPITNCVNT